MRYNRPDRANPVNPGPPPCPDCGIEPLRLFFGLDIPAGTALAAADWRDRHLPAIGRAVAPANFHITLAFIGEVPAAGLDALCQDTDQWLARSGTGPAEILLDEVGYWPAPGIYWLGPRQWPPELDRLAEGLGRVAQRAGGRRDRRRYRPHLTLFRGCREAPPAPAWPPSLRLAYDAVTLFESRRGRGGVQYDAIADWPLADA